MADMAGISFDQTRTLESIGFQLYSYNESYEQFFANVFRDVKDFSPTREFFETSRARRIRNLKNHKLAEPSQLVTVYFTEAMYTDYPLMDQMIEEMEGISFEKFLLLKNQWLQKMHLTWLI